MDILVVATVAIVVLVVIIGVVLVARRSGSDTLTAEPTPARPVTGVVDRSLAGRLSRSRSALTTALGGVFASSDVSDDTWNDIEEALIAADVGPRAAEQIVSGVRARGPSSGIEARSALEAELATILARTDRSLSVDSHPAVIVVVGVNGTGKTTSIAKVAKHLVDDGRSVVLGAADTYRAAADTQLRTWGDRVGVPVVSGGAGADPASVAFEAYRRAVDDDADVVIIDTAGRLHSQANLMDELAKVVRVLGREAGHIDEVLLVLDGTVGQNGIAQAAAFTTAVGVTGVILTKLDGTARGGVAVAIEQQLDVPVKLIGLGEGMDDLIPFDAQDFAHALVAE
ncbi:MAG TPA: signal recognition particle-docking protein FtsY [Acidimicrobiia bacterium]|nr:signal recognition particle-docking protein FtsY [Acidimicrobiia bacterium]